MSDAQIICCVCRKPVASTINDQCWECFAASLEQPEAVVDWRARAEVAEARLATLDAAQPTTKGE